MPNIVSSTADILKKLNAEFFAGINGDKRSKFDKLANVTKSSTVNQTYAISSMVPGIREWLDQIEYTDGRIYELIIQNKGWQSGFMEDRLNYMGMNNNVSGNLQMQIQKAVGDWIYFKDKLINSVFENNLLAFDGTALFADTRPNIDTGTNTADNIVTGTGVTIDTITADLDSAIDQLNKLRDKNGLPFNVDQQLVVLAPSHLERKFRKILGEGDLITIGGVQTTNYWSGLADLITNPYQGATDNDWYLINAANSFRPVIIQEMEPPKYNVKDDLDQRHIKFFATSFMGYGAGNPFSIIKVNN